MRWVKSATLCHEFDVSTQTIKTLIDNGTLQEGVHFKVFPFGKRFNVHLIEKMSTIKDENIERLLDDMLQL